MNQSILTLLPGGQQQDRSLGFEAKSVEISNLTSSYLRLPDSPPDIPPWVYGAVRALAPGTRQARAVLVPVTPAIPGPPVPVSQATLTWSDLQLSPSPGHLLQQVTTSQANVISSPSAPANTTTGPTNVPVPAGTQSIGFLVYGGAGHAVPNSLLITGHQTGATYVSAGGTQLPNGVQWASFDPTDTSVDVTLTAPFATGSQVDILASPLAMAVDVSQAPLQALTVNTASVSQVNGGPLGPTSAGQGVAVTSAGFSATVAASASATIVAGVVNKTITVGPTWMLPNTAQLNYHLQDTLGDVIGRGSSNVAPNIPQFDVDFSGRALPLSSGLQVTNDSSTTSNGFNGAVAYAQQ